MCKGRVDADLCPLSLYAYWDTPVACIPVLSDAVVVGYLSAGSVATRRADSIERLADEHQWTSNTNGIT